MRRTASSIQQGCHSSSAPSLGSCRKPNFPVLLDGILWYRPALLSSAAARLPRGRAQDGGFQPAYGDKLSFTSRPSTAPCGLPPTLALILCEDRKRTIMEYVHPSGSNPLVFRRDRRSVPKRFRC